MVLLSIDGMISMFTEKLCYSFAINMEIFNFEIQTFHWRTRPLAHSNNVTVETEFRWLVYLLPLTKMNSSSNKLNWNNMECIQKIDILFENCN